MLVVSRYCDEAAKIHGQVSRGQPVHGMEQFFKTEFLFHMLSSMRENRLRKALSKLGTGSLAAWFARQKEMDVCRLD